MKIQKKDTWIYSLLIVLLIISVGYYLLDTALFDSMGSLAKNKAVTAATAAIEDTIFAAASQKDTDSLSEIHRDLDGKILSMSTNTKELAVFRAQLTEALTEETKDLRVQLQIPLGSVIGGSIFSGKGIPIKLYVVSAGGLLVDTESQFESAGLNQTCHRIYVTVSIDLTILYHGHTETVNVSTKVLASETVIVGEVPAAYFGTYQKSAD